MLALPLLPPANVGDQPRRRRALSPSAAGRPRPVSPPLTTTDVMAEFVKENPSTPAASSACDTLGSFIAALKPAIIILVKAGPAVDAVVKRLIAAGVEKTTSSSTPATLWTSTIRRERIRPQLQILRLRRRRRTGCSLRPLSPPAVTRVIGNTSNPSGGFSAKVDAKPASPQYAQPAVIGGVLYPPTSAPNNAGKYVAMVHNAIEYVDMQLIMATLPRLLKAS